MIDEQATELVYKPSLYNKLFRWLFPSAPEPRNNKDTRTYITTRIWINISWDDRIRMLFLGRAKIQVRTYTDVLVNEAESHSVFSVE